MEGMDLGQPPLALWPCLWALKAAYHPNLPTHHPESAQPEHPAGARAAGDYVIKPYHCVRITLTTAFALRCLVDPWVKYDVDGYNMLNQ